MEKPETSTSGKSEANESVLHGLEAPGGLAYLERGLPKHPFLEGR